MTDERKPFSVVDIGEAKDTAKIKAAIGEAERLFNARLPAFSLIAKEHFAQFQAYKNEGFTETQALRLVIASIQRPS